MEFTYQAYMDMLTSLKDNGYENADYFTSENFEKCAVLRHDIDMSIDKALQLAKLEASAGVKSTYFVLLGTHFYNIAERENRQKLIEIKELGHDIGLHFDELNYPASTDVEAAILNEASVMEQLLGVEIKTVSMHRPSKETLAANYQLKGELVNSYGSIFFNSYKYVSDSRMRWREDVMDIIKSNAFPKLHILTHAFWYNDEELPIGEILRLFIANAGKERYSALHDNLTDLDSIIENVD